MLETSAFSFQEKTAFLKKWGIRSFNEMSKAIYSIKAYGVNVSISADKSIMA